MARKDKNEYMTDAGQGSVKPTIPELEEAADQMYDVPAAESVPNEDEFIASIQKDLADLGLAEEPKEKQNSTVPSWDDIENQVKADAEEHGKSEGEKINENWNQKVAENGYDAYDDPAQAIINDSAAALVYPYLDQIKQDASEQAQTAIEENTKNNEQPEPIFPIAPSGPMYPGEERAIEREPGAAPETPEQTEQKRSEETPDFVPEWMKQAQSGNGMTAGSSGQAQPVSAAAQQYIDPVIAAANELIDQKLAEADPTSRENKFDQRYNDALEAILNREKFSYDVNSDELYRQYARQYQNNAELAMRDAMARAQAATGGYGSSYSQQVGQQAYDQQMRELDAVIPELYQAAYGRYQDEGDEMLTGLQLIGAERDREDAIAQQEWENQYKTQQQAYDAAQQDFENQLKIAQLEEEARANDMRYKTGNTYTAMSADKVADKIAGYTEDKDLDGLNTFLGLMVDDGMDPEQAWNIYRKAAIEITGQDPGSFEANIGG